MSPQTAELSQTIDTATAERIVWTFTSRGRRRDKIENRRKYTDMQRRSDTEERKRPSHPERSTIRYTQHGDTRDATSDRERWKVTERRERERLDV